jgi:uncharacterized NAD(P)/FAD-binding protein YdhS
MEHEMEITTRPSRRVVIVGGGASGVIFAVNLARASRDTEIILIERRADLGRGLAYSTKDPNHLLNVRVANMSAFHNDPDHFFRWLQDYGSKYGVNSPSRFGFVPRQLYGEYLANLLAEETPQGVRLVRSSCENIVELPGEVRLGLSDRSVLAADAVIIATGHDPRAELPNSATINPWSPGALDGIARDAPVLIIGTGLTMADVVLSLHRKGHEGQIIAVSRRGLRSAVHADIHPRPLPRSQVPFGAPISELTRWVRELVRQCEAEGAEWRSAIDSLRPHTRLLWQSMSLQQRLRFLRHARPWWEAHRHRMAPVGAVTINGLITEGRLRILAAKILKVQKSGIRIGVTLRRRGTHDVERLEFARVFNCAGLSDDLRQSPNPVIQSLFARGLARPDALSLGLDVSEDNALLGWSGQPSQRIFAVGPVARGAFWEITAVPDIRQQCFDLAGHLAAKLGRSRSSAPRVRWKAQ